MQILLFFTNGISHIIQESLSFRAASYERGRSTGLARFPRSRLAILFFVKISLCLAGLARSPRCRFLRPKGPLHMSPVTGLARLPGPEWCGVFIWEISARSTGMNSRNTTKMVERKLVLFATVLALLLLKWKYIQDQNYAILASM